MTHDGYAREPLLESRIVTRPLAPLLLLALAAAALEPTEVYRRAKTACVAIQTNQRWRLGVVLSRADGLVLTARSVTAGAEWFEVHAEGGVRRATLLGADSELGLALLFVKDLKDLAPGELPLAPALRNAKEVVEQRVYSVGRIARGAPLRFAQGIAARLRRFKGASMLTIEHDGNVAASPSGGPLLDTEARLLGLCLASGDAIPVNAIRLFLQRQGQKTLGKLPPDALPVTVRSRDKKVDKPEEKARLPAFKVPDGLRYAPYVHTIGSREKRSLEIRFNKLLVSLAGVYYRCPLCKGSGKIQELVREGYYDGWRNYIPPLYRTITCTRCKGPGKLFNLDKCRGAFAAATRAERGTQRQRDQARDLFVRRVRTAERSFMRRTRYSVEVLGRLGIVNGPANNPLFPILFKLLPLGRDYKWVLHSPLLNGPFEYGREGRVRSEGRVIAVPAGDMLALSDGRIVRICGIAVPEPNGKLPRRGAFVRPNESVRKLVERELLGKTVALGPDKYSKVTCSGLAIAFVKLGDVDYGAELLRRGIVRRHPKHIHMRNHGYKKAETEAKRAKLGIWKK